MNDGDYLEVVCPTCFETFAIRAPPVEEVPAEIDYDCEICCRPMVISLWPDGGGVAGDAAALSD